MCSKHTAKVEKCISLKVQTYSLSTMKLVIGLLVILAVGQDLVCGQSDDLKKEVDDLRYIVKQLAIGMIRNTLKMSLVIC